MKFLKKFESHESGMSREEMCDMLCNCGYTMEELEGCPDHELADMCKNVNSESSEGTYEGLKEHQENENYMFFANIENIHRMCEEILAMDKNSIDKVLSDGHGWATDHIATSKDDVEEVFNFLKTHSHESEELIGGPKASYPRPVYNEPSFDETEGQLANKDLESEIKSFKDFK
jgi:hypothetical protein